MNKIFTIGCLLLFTMIAVAQKNDPQVFETPQRIDHVHVKDLGITFERSSQKLELNAPQHADHFFYSIYDLTGRKIKKRDITLDKAPTAIPLSDLKGGVYILLLQSQYGERRSFKFII